MKTIRVAAAIIIIDEKILCVQRGQNKYDYISKKFEFPGGKIEEGERPHDTVVREIQEELNMTIKVVKECLVVKHTYPHFNLVMHSFICSSTSKSLKLTEHISHKWLTRNELSQLDWAAADLPIVEWLNHNEQ